MKQAWKWGLVILWFAVALVGSAAAEGGLPAQVPVPGMVTLVDLGAHKCIPCKMMAPILDELKTEYEGRAAVLFIDVWENREAAARFGIRAIPTQIFYDKEGREVFRHVGFLDKKSIVHVLRKLGVH
ncbi:thioredoxin 1 [Desulfacinum hydrothermale DSM 13146]|uniref:Thioredoxin 1 n=1 Tax=Desulfacinum hydrothermale DSM 13146 TaxID=1121390 RepID=A0A1W1XP04_9BACT|nr:thioredoxin family protein [Desulfacinum hydrothermale]SMC25709.1 thioredoxin 1 [Desulfacinum hydrothermale DSM 13146]